MFAFDSPGSSLYLSNVCRDIATEELLCACESVAPVRSLTQMESSRDDGTCAIVTYFLRHDAARALRELDGYRMRGVPLIASFSRLVHAPLPIVGAACATAANYLMGFDRWSSSLREMQLVECVAGAGAFRARACAVCAIVCCGVPFEGKGNGVGEASARGKAGEVWVPRTIRAGEV